MTKALEKSKTELLRMGCGLQKDAGRMAQSAWRMAQRAGRKGQRAKAAHS